MTDEVSKALFERAKARIPGGVTSPVRAFRAVGGEPIFIRRAEGCWLEGANGERYVDYVGSWGPMILGHANAGIVKAIRDAAGDGTSFGAPSEREVLLAEALCEAIPSMEMVRLTSSGTEELMSALRVARGFTKRDLIVKFEGCYHGHADYLLSKAGSGLATFGVPDSAGVPAAIAGTALTATYNDLPGLTALFDAHRDQIAAVILEPVVGNMGCVPPREGFLEGIAALCKSQGALLVFDEVMTGFRVAFGGAQARFGIRPDLTTLAKIAGGGVPMGAFGGRRDAMSLLAPLGPVYQAGTLSGNPIATAAGLASLEQLRAKGVYETLERTGTQLEAGLRDAAKSAGVAVQVQRVGSMWTVFFTSEPVVDWPSAAKCDKDRFARWHAAMLSRGVYLPPSQFEAAFHSVTHDDAAIEKTLAAAREAFRAVA